MLYRSVCYTTPKKVQCLPQIWPGDIRQGRFFQESKPGPQRKMNRGLLLLLSRFSHVRLCVTPEMATHQAPPSLGFSRQEYWSGCHFLLQCMKVKSESEVAQSCLTLSDPMDCSLPGSSTHGIFQARVLAWGAIAFSGAINLALVNSKKLKSFQAYFLITMQ